MLSNSLQGIYDDFGERNFTTLATGFGFHDGGRKLEPFVFLGTEKNLIKAVTHLKGRCCNRDVICRVCDSGILGNVHWLVRKEHVTNRRILILVEQYYGLFNLRLKFQKYHCSTAPKKPFLKRFDTFNVNLKEKHRQLPECMGFEGSNCLGPVFVGPIEIYFPQGNQLK